MNEHTAKPTDEYNCYQLTTSHHPCSSAGPDLNLYTEIQPQVDVLKRPKENLNTYQNDFFQLARDLSTRVEIFVKDSILMTLSMFSPISGVSKLQYVQCLIQCFHRSMLWVVARVCPYLEDFTTSRSSRSSGSTFPLPSKEAYLPRQPRDC